jgi:hypothetical protein
MGVQYTTGTAYTIMPVVCSKKCFINDYKVLFQRRRNFKTEQSETTLRKYSLHGAYEVLFRHGEVGKTAVEGKGRLLPLQATLAFLLAFSTNFSLF